MNLFISLLAFYYAFVFNIPVTTKIYQLSHYQMTPFVMSTPFLLFFCFIIVFSFICQPFFYKPVSILLVTTSSLALYASMKYRVMFDYSMIENIFETNTSEAGSYLNISSIFYFSFFGVLPSILILFTDITYSTSVLKEALKRVVLILVALIGACLIAIFFYKDYASVGRNNSYLNKMINPAHVYNTFKYINRTYLTSPEPYQTIGKDAKLKPSDNKKDTLFVVVLGETARSMNFYYNGYKRNTNPYTTDMGLISFKQVSSCGTATAVSVPCMFSNMNRSDYKKSKASNQDNVMDVIGHAGVNLLWKDNDGGDKGVATHFVKIATDPTQNSPLCDGDTCHDEVLLAGLDKEISERPGNTLITLHMIGSHGPTYFQRYPKSMTLFSPACESKDIEKCTDAEIRNTYDNTIAYTDYFISELIKKLETYQSKYNVAMMYISDHGESLGENGLYLHGTPYTIAPSEQTTVPWLMWIPDQYADAKGIDKNCLAGLAKSRHFSQDNFFHTLIGLFGVITSAKNPSLDITESCIIS
ncbi:phosphoethanolamine transferase [Photobacterium halotolerans]|uniref:Hydrolase n=1 Tax=Photobacterium halotolerans TaxID=265726 RepID=A0A0F5VCZ5_9GAMM|nr:phosphoethanolamine--lipid A transferase [Photobacterium halotolerans]KKC99364.1 hydrolase [Photobacterium halotolerans]